MISKILLFVLLESVFCREITDFEITTEFANFMGAYGREYSTVEETMTRYKIFAENYKKIQEVNEVETDFQLGVNQFADLTEEEFKKTYLTLTPSRTPCKLKHTKTNPQNIIDWREKGAVSRVKDQGSCGSCWTFSTTGALEGRAKLKTGGDLVEFSEQELVDCAGSYGDNGGCKGGDMSQAFEYIVDNGLATEKDYPYVARNNPCKSKSIARAVKITGCVNITRDDSNELLEALATGPVSIAVTAGNINFQYYRSGILKNCGSTTAELDHGITLVGAGMEGSEAYWIAKNSWGSRWGDSGYIKILRITTKGPGMCKIAHEASYPVV